MTSTSSTTRSSAPQPFHRPPPTAPTHPAPEPTPDVEVPDEPRPPSHPAWVPLVSGVVVGSIVAVVTGHALVALFGATAFVTAVVAWGSMILVHRRRRRLWRNAVRRRRHVRAAHCVATIEWSAERERRRHPSIDSLVRLVTVGDEYLWSRRPSDGERSIWEVEVRRRTEVHDVDGYRYVCADVPETVDLGPGAIVGVHGPAAGDLARALVLRLASAVGPSDLDVVGASAAVEFAVPHWRGSIEHTGVDDRTDVHVLIVCGDPSDVASRTATARRWVAAGRAALVVCAMQRDQLPHNCTAVLEADDGIGGTTSLDELEVALGRWTDPDLVGSDVPTFVHWTELYSHSRDGNTPWVSSIGRCAARLGMASDGRVDVDLVNDGPHMVVIGTTGSGKSEFLRTLILGIATEAPPERVQFVLVDFKGGAAFDAVRDLPHVVDVLTDLDRDATSGEEAGQRVVDGLRAELVRREHVLRDRGASSLIDLEAADPIGEEIPPRLVIVIDELARLQADVPAFVTALVDLAQRGRSLGMHLVVGTQTAGRVVSSEVLANADIRVALRLNAASDSVEVVGSPVAARLSRSSPGRAVLRLGTDDPVIFQVASTHGALTNEVDRLVDAARCRGFERARPIWCPPLPERLPVDAVSSDAIGRLDDRRHQAQPEYRWNAESNVLVIGRRGSGTTAALSALVDRWCRLRSVGDDRPVVAWFVGRDVGDHETVDRSLRFVESAIDRDVLVVVEGIDTWSDRQSNGRPDMRLWERFDAVVGRRSVTLVASSRRDPMGVSRLGERFDHVLAACPDGPLVPGRFRVEKTPVDDASGSWMQFVEPPAEPSSAIFRPGRLAADVMSPSTHDFAIRASDLRPVAPAVFTVFLVVGPRGSGRSTTLRRWSESWAAHHREGTVHWIDSTDAWRAVVDEPPSGQCLVIVDDTSEIWSGVVLGDLETIATRGVHLAVAVTPSVLRARPDHALHVLRRHRNGLVLGPSAHEDADLFGVFDLERPFVEPAPGRGWLVDRGEVVDLVQVVRPVGIAP